MLSNQKLQNSLDEIKEISRMDSALYSVKGRFLAATDSMEISKISEQQLREFIEAAPDRQNDGKYLMMKVAFDGETEYVLVCRIDHPEYEVYAKMAFCQIRNLVMSYAERFDRNNFIQNILLGNMLVVDIYRKAKKYHVNPGARVAFVIDTGEKDNDLAMEFVKNIADIRSGDFVTSVDKQSIILVKDVSRVAEKELEEKLLAIAESLVAHLQSEALIRVRVGYGNVVSEIPEIAQSYQEAKMALEVGRVFYAGLDTVSYGKLGIGRLIYQLPMSLCDMFIKEVFGNKIPDILEDEEAMSIINKFFENNLNISETARQLYIHRNTLVYRLERYEKAIGMNICTFDDAMTFRIAVMVIAHMKNQDHTI